MATRYLVHTPKGYRSFKLLTSARAFAKKMEALQPKYGRVPVLMDAGSNSARFVPVPDNYKKNPLSLFKKYYVTCDGKKFGPYKTMAKAKKVAETVARVLDKPAKILGAATTRTNPSIRKTKKRMKRLAGFQKADLTLDLLRRGRGGVKPKRKFKASTKRKTNLKRKANPKRKYTVTASLRSTGRPKFKTITATSLEDAKRKARKWMDSTFKKSSGPVDFSITY